MSRIVYLKFGKRTIDIFLSSLGIIFLWPVFLIIAFLIKLSSPGPAIFKQKRVGKNGKPLPSINSGQWSKMQKN